MKATEKQKRYVQSLSMNFVDFTDEQVNALSKFQASKLIDLLKEYWYRRNRNILTEIEYWGFYADVCDIAKIER